jgi:hypothetical protein
MFSFFSLFFFVDGSKLTRIDPTHPTLRGFELEYHWESVQEEDLSLGIQVLFTSAVLGYLVLLFSLLYVRGSFSGEDKSIVGGGGAGTNTPTTPGSAGGRFIPRGGTSSANGTPTGSGKYRKTFQ